MRTKSALSVGEPWSTLVTGEPAANAVEPSPNPHSVAENRTHAGLRTRRYTLVPPSRRLTKGFSMISTTRNTRARRVGQASGAAVTLSLAAMVMAGPASAAQVPSASVANDTLTVTATQASEPLALRLQAGAPGVLEVDFGDDGTADFSLDRATFSRIDVLLRAGDDQFRIDQVNGAFPDEALTVDGGNGNDTMNGGDGVEVFYGGNNADSVDGNRGNDTADLGNGTDSFTWDPGDGSDIVEGQLGVDTLDFNGASIALENMFLTPNGSRSLFHRDQGPSTWTWTESETRSGRARWRRHHPYRRHVRHRLRAD